MCGVLGELIEHILAMTSPATSPPNEPCFVAKEEQASDLVATPDKSPASAVAQPSPYTAFPRPKRVFILAVVTVAGFIGPLAGNIYLPALPVLEHEFQVSAAAINATVSVFMAVFGFGVSPLTKFPRLSATMG